MMKELLRGVQLSVEN